MTESLKAIPRFLWALLVIATLTILAAVLGCGDEKGDDTPKAPDAIYGPKPCLSDQECQAEHGAGWYCDTSGWPTCKASPGIDAGNPDAVGSRDVFALYGPPPIDAGEDAAIPPDASLPSMDAGAPDAADVGSNVLYGPVPPDDAG